MFVYLSEVTIVADKTLWKEHLYAKETLVLHLMGNG